MKKYLLSNILIIILIIILAMISLNIFNTNSRRNKKVNSKKIKENFNNQKKIIEDEMNNANFNKLMVHNNNIHKEKEKKIEGFSNNKTKCSFKPLDPTIFEDNKNICCLNHEKCRTGGTVFCNYGATNFAYPKDMSPIDYKLFKLNYSNNFTIQDYVNWLSCFKNSKESLPYNHLKNLFKIERGEQLVYKKGVMPPPARINAPLTSQEYFNKLYNNQGQIKIAYPLHSVSGALLGSNFNDYPYFYQNFQQYGSSGRIFNIKDLSKKYNASFVDRIITPEVRPPQTPYEHVQKNKKK